jgi:hypothetical protein
VTATWAGITRPTADVDHLRLYALGSGDGYPAVILAWWPTNGAAAGNLLLALPAELAVGWYELRLYGSDPDYPSLAQMIARSEPIRVGGSATSDPPTTTTLPGASCDVACDDGDPCTIDDCASAGACASTQASGFASVTCTCERVSPAACAGQRLPASIARACGLFDDAAGATDGRQAVKRLRKGVKALKESLAKTRKGGITRDCAGALKAELHDAKGRVERLLATLGRPRR